METHTTVEHPFETLEVFCVLCKSDIPGTFVGRTSAIAGRQKHAKETGHGEVYMEIHKQTKPSRVE